MHSFVQLVKLYREHGYAISTGMPAWSDGFDGNGPLTYIYKGGKHGYADRHCVTHAGIGMQEVFFLQALSDSLRPRHVFVVGHAFGSRLVPESAAKLKGRPSARRKSSGSSNATT